MNSELEKDIKNRSAKLAEILESLKGIYGSKEEAEEINHELKKDIENRRVKLSRILESRGLFDEVCECGFLRSEHADIGPAIGHGGCALSECVKFTWTPKKLKKEQ